MTEDPAFVVYVDLQSESGETATILAWGDTVDEAVAWAEDNFADGDWAMVDWRPA